MDISSQLTYKLASLPELIIDGEIIPEGQPTVLRINAGRLASDNKINVFGHVYHTGIPGPSVLILGGIHGDEINGIEIVRQTVAEDLLSQITRGTLIVIPLLNIYGFINFTRDVHDGKDINRSFPGHTNGSLASRVARIITKKILPFVDIAIDFHTGGNARYNYPQMRYAKQDAIATQLAKASGLRYLVEQPLIANSFRRSAKDMGIPACVYEGGEAVRFDKLSIYSGKMVIKNLLLSCGMLPEHTYESTGNQFIIKKHKWLRASHPGLFIWSKKSGDEILVGEKLGEIHDPYGTRTAVVISPYSGHIIGHNNASVVSLGDPLFHIGTEFEKIS
jgi:hypothetical protein